MVTKVDKQQIPKEVVITAIIAITLLEICAMLNGFNGLLLKAVLVIIAGMAGFLIPSPIKVKS